MGDGCRRMIGFTEAGKKQTRWVDFKNGLKPRKKKKRKLVMGLSLIFQRIGFKTFSGRYSGHWIGIGIASSPVNQLSKTKLYGRGNPNKSTIDRF
jgi:hypothetical protein